MATDLLRLPQVQQRTGLSRSEIYRRMSLGDFPQKVALGVRVVGWVSEEIDAYIQSRIAASRKGA